MLINFNYKVFGDDTAYVEADVTADDNGIAVIESAEFYTLRGHLAPSKMIMRVIKKIPYAWERFIQQATEAAEKKAAEQRRDYYCDPI